MNKQEYLKYKETIKAQRDNLYEQEKQTRKIFIDQNAPCLIGDNVLITTHTGRKIQGSVNGFSIDQNCDVYVSSVKPEKGPNIYLSVNYQSIQII